MATREMQTERITNQRGEPFRVVRWPSREKAKGLLVIQHGLGEHGARYQAVADGLAHLPLDVWTFDARGHGESVGKRGDANGFNELVDDLTEMIALAKARTGHERVFLYGHSMGGAVVSLYGATRDLDPAIKAIVLSAPALSIPRTVNNVVKKALAQALRSIAPTLTLPSGLSPQGISSDPAEVERYRTDPLVHPMLSVRLGLSFFDDAATALAQAGRINVPTLVFHGDADPIVDIEGARLIAKGIGTDDVRYEELRGFKHEPHHETAARRAELFKILAEWLGARL